MFGVPEIDSHTLAAHLKGNRSSYRLIDVRGPGEWGQGVIAGAELVPLHVVPLQAQDWAENVSIVFYCRSGARSAQACAFMMSRGQSNVLNLRGGILDWARQGLPLAQSA